MFSCRVDTAISPAISLLLCTNLPKNSLILELVFNHQSPFQIIAVILLSLKLFSFFFFFFFFSFLQQIQNVTIEPIFHFPLKNQSVLLFTGLCSIELGATIVALNEMSFNTESFDQQLMKDFNSSI